MRGRRMAAALPVLLAAAVILGGAAARRAVAAMEFDRSHYRDRVVVIDAGHGGEDGGAVSLTGVPESQLNLAVALRVDALLGLYGEQVVMLREEDVSLHSPQAETLREKKSSDLRNRAAAVEAVEGAVLLSIHQNSYPDSRYRGAQVFYAPTQGSEALARYAQQLLRRTLDPDNDRECKPISKDIYLMNHVSCPAILVECGFLTNPEEEALLRSGTYQTKVASALAGACLYRETSIQ